jgi:C4-dicarboxylate transporter, DctM subunit
VGISKRLTDWAKSLLGWLPGGLGVVTVFSCAIFAALTGSGPATVAAIGSIMLPAMTKAGYSKATGAGLVASAGALGPIIPPSIPMIVYGVTMNLSIPEMFVAGVIPGLVIAVCLSHCQCDLCLPESGSIEISQVPLNSTPGTA